MSDSQAPYIPKNTQEEIDELLGQLDGAGIQRTHWINHRIQQLKRKQDNENAETRPPSVLMQLIEATKNS